MKIALGIIVLGISLSVSAQPGIYSELDVEHQNKFMQAQIFKFTGETEKQIETLKEYLLMDESSHAAMYELARAYHQEKNSELAIKYAKKAFLLDKNPWYGIVLADAYESEQLYDQSELIFSQLIQLDPDNYSHYHRLAFAQQIQGKGLDAVYTFNQLEQQQGILEGTSKRKFEIYSNLNKEKEAILELESLANAYPDNVRFLNNLASYLDRIGKHKKALEVYRTVLEKDPSNSQANLAFVHQDIDNAKDDQYLNAIAPLIENESIPLDAKVKELIPYVIQMSEDENNPTTQALITNAEKLVQAYPNEAKVYALKGDILYNLNKNSSALKSYKKATSLDKTVFTIWGKCLTMLYEIQDFKELDNYASEAIDQFPNQFDAYFFSGLAKLAFDNQEAFEDILFEAEFVAGKINTNIIKLNALKALQLLNTNNAKGALEIIEQLELENEIIPYAIEIFGDVYAANNDIKTAIQYWNKAQVTGNRSIKLLEKITQKKFIE